VIQAYVIGIQEFGYLFDATQFRIRHNIGGLAAVEIALPVVPCAESWA
jgi:hypothetical protein